MLSIRNSNPYLVSVCMITYNHEQYIDQAIMSVIMQNCNVPFELVIGEDCSNDGTKIICRKYAHKNPHIKLLTASANIGVVNNFIRTLKECKSKYIAICEGDDYWIDDKKLQKQIDFLEANPDYGLIYSDIKMVDQNGLEINSTPYYEMLKGKYSEGYIFWDLISGNFINTLTVCLRKELIDDYLFNYPTEWFMYDYRLWLHVAQRTKLKFMNEKTACFRIHPKGISKSNDFFYKRTSLSILSALNDYFNNRDHFHLSLNDQIILGKTLFNIIRNKKLSIKEKSNIWPFLIKNKSYGLRSLLKLLTLKLFNSSIKWKFFL